MIFLHTYECQDNTKAFSKKKLLENLAHYLKKNPSEIIISHNKNGKPFVDSIFFSVSHCRDKIVQTFTQNGDIGIDIEYKNTKRSFLGLSNRYFHSKEHEHLVGLANKDALDLFYDLWTAKESVCKAHGGRLWYYLADNYLTKKQKMSPKINGMHLRKLSTIPDFSLTLASKNKIEKIVYV